MAHTKTTIPPEAQLDFLLAVERMLTDAEQVRHQRDRLLEIARAPAKAPRRPKGEPAR